MVKFKVNRDEFARIWNMVVRAVPGRTPREVLKYVHLRVLDGMLTLTAHDSRDGLTVSTTDCETGKHHLGELLLPHERTSSIVKESDGAESLIISGNQNGVEPVEFTFGQSVFRLQAESADNYPHVTTEMDRAVAVPAALLSTAIARVMFAADAKATNYVLSGVQFNNIGDRIELRATDQRVLAKSSVPMGEMPGVWPDRHPIVGLQVLKLVQVACREHDGDVTIHCDGSVIVFEAGNTTVFGRLLEGRFPSVDKIELKHTGGASVMVRDLAWLLRMASITTERDSNAITLEFDAGEVRSRSSIDKLGSSTNTRVNAYSGEPYSVVLDPQAAQRWLSVLPMEANVSLAWESSEDPVLFAYESSSLVVAPKVAAT